MGLSARAGHGLSGPASSRIDHAMHFVVGVLAYVGVLLMIIKPWREDQLR